VAAPAPADPGLIHLEITPAQALVPAGQAGRIAARVRIRADAGEVGGRPPVNLALVIDTSGSMAGTAIDNARVAAGEVLAQLADGDRLALVVFHSTAEVLVSSTELTTENRDALRGLIDRMVARGTTNLGAGLGLGIREVQGALRADGINRIILVSDGVPNDPSHITTFARGAGQSGIAITALGLGLECDETLLTSIAQHSGGTYHFLERPELVAQVLRDEVLALRRVAARNMALQVAPGPGVTITGVVGHQPQAYGRGTQVLLGELAQGETRELFVELRFGTHRSDAVVELADAILGFDDAVVQAGRLERRGFASVVASSDAAAIRASEDRELVLELERAWASAVTLQVIATARAGQLEEARKMLARAEKDTRQLARALKDPELERAARAMVELKDALPSLVPPPVDPTAPQPTAVDPVPAGVVKRTHAWAVEMLQPRPITPR
jgi:Ca-activated chloride channel family protein